MKDASAEVAMFIKITFALNTKTSQRMDSNEKKIERRAKYFYPLLLIILHVNATK